MDLNLCCLSPPVSHLLHTSHPRAALLPLAWATNPAVPCNKKNTSFTEKLNMQLGDLTSKEHPVPARAALSPPAN